MSVASPTPWPHTQNFATGQQTFQARRPLSSNEHLALRKKAIEQALNAPPVNTINLQDSSEFTARVRKLASRDSDPLFKLNRNGTNTREPNPVMKGGGTVPNNTSSNMIARQAGNAYSANYYNWSPQQEYQSAGCSTLLNDNVTFPRKVVCPPPQFPRVYDVVFPYSQRIRFGLKKNSNKGVISRHTNSLAVTSGQCGIATLY